MSRRPDNLQYGNDITESLALWSFGTFSVIVVFPYPYNTALDSDFIGAVLFFFYLLSPQNLYNTPITSMYHDVEGPVLNTQCSLS